MTEAVMNDQFLSDAFPKKALNASATFWFVVAAIGHWIFVAYILGVFGPPIVQNGLEGLADTHLPGGFIEGDTLGNLAAAAHVLLAAIIIGGGPLQLIPQIRARFPTFHHWLGRSYLVTAVASSIAGLYMVWTRGSVGELVNDIAISIDAVLIVAFAAIAVRYAIARDIKRHRRWAMRLFMVASGVWFFRVGLMAWTMLTGGLGIDFESFTGPFIYAWGFGQYLLPLAILELYFRTQDHPSPGRQLGVAFTLVALTVVMGIGIFAATMGMWLPRM